MSGSVSLGASGGLFDSAASGLHVLARAFDGIAAGYSERNGRDRDNCSNDLQHAVLPFSLTLAGKLHSTRSEEASDVDETPGDGCCRRHGGTHQMRAASCTLATLEIAIRRRRAALAGIEAIIVHRQAH